MATNPLLQSIREAVRLNKELGRLFGMVGNSSHPRGHILTAYRVALLALRADTSPNAVREVMRNLRNQIEREAREFLIDATAIGHRSALAQAAFYGFAITPPPPDLQRIEQQAGAIADQVQAQASAAVGLSLMGREDELIVGMSKQKPTEPAEVIEIKKALIS